MADHSFFIRPLESLFFGPPHSFSAGETHHGRSLFPPPLSAFQGLIRTALLQAVNPPLDLDDFSREARGSRAALVGDADRLPRGWQLHGPYPAEIKTGQDQLTPWLPTPRMILKGPKEAPLYARWLANAQGGMDDLPRGRGRLLGRPEHDAVSPLGGWCSAENFLALLNGQAERTWDQEGWKMDYPPFVRREDQAGLALGQRQDGKRSITARHGMLYFQKRLRLDPDSGFVGGLSARELPAGVSASALTSGAGLWGRRGRPVALEEWRKDAFCQSWRDMLGGKHLPQEIVAENDLFWLVILTPVALEDPIELRPRLNIVGVEFETLAALPGPPINLGGYDMTTGRPRDNNNYLPAGSAWLFRLKGGDGASRRQALHSLNNAFPLGEPIQAAFGYGHCLVGIAPAGTDQQGEKR